MKMDLALNKDATKPKQTNKQTNNLRKIQNSKTILTEKNSGTIGPIAEEEFILKFLILKQILLSSRTITFTFGQIPLRKVRTPYPPSYGFNSTTTILLEGRL